MRAWLLAAGLVAAGFATPALAIDKLLCISDQATGFKLSENGRWEQVNFNVGDERYLVQREGQARAWTVKKFGSNEIATVCEMVGEITIYCGSFVRGGGSRGWHINLMSLRFVEFDGGGYVSDAHVWDAWLTIGRCSPLQ